MEIIGPNWIENMLRQNNLIWKSVLRRLFDLVVISIVIHVSQFIGIEKIVS